MDEVAEALETLEHIGHSFFDSDRSEYPRVLEDIRTKFRNRPELESATRSALDLVLSDRVSEDTLLVVVREKFNRAAKDGAMARSFLSFLRDSLFPADS